jgi:hypothetical protein
MRRAVKTPHAATNVASAAHVLAKRVESLSPASSEAASRRNAGGAKTSPHAPTRRGPHKADEAENLLAATASHLPRSAPRQRCPATRMNKTIKSVTSRLSAGRRGACLSQPRAPSIDGGKLRHGVRPRETRPEHPAEQNRRRGGRWGRRSRPPKGTSKRRRDRGRGYVRPRTSSSVTTSLLLSISHTLSSLALWTAGGSANSV